MIREVAAKLGVEVDGGQLVSFLGVLDKAKAGLAGLAAGLALGAAAAFVKAQIEAADALGDEAEQLGVTTDELERFQYAVKLAGGESEGSGKALFLLNKQLGEAATAGSPAAKAFGELGIKLKDANGKSKTAMEVLPELADKVAEAGSHAEATAIATGFFGKQALNLLPLLKRGREGVAELNAEFTDLGLGMGKDFAQAAGDAQAQMDRMDFATKALKMQLVSALLPAVTKLVGWLIKGVAWFNRIAKETNMVKVLTVALGAALALKLIPMVFTGVRAFMALRTAMFGASMPLWLVIAGITAIVLIIEDLWTLMEGGDSLIGKLLDKFAGVGAKEKLVTSLKNAWKFVVDLWGDAKTAITDLWKAMGPDAVTKLGEAFTFLIKGIAASVKGLTGLVSIVDKVIAGDYSGALAEANKTADAIFGKSQSMKTIDGKGNVTEVKENVGGLFGISDKEYQTKLALAGLAPGPAPKIQNDVKTAFTVTVPPGTDPSKVTIQQTGSTAVADAYHGAVTGVGK